MKITAEHLAGLARLSLSEEEKGLFSVQIENILGYVDKLNELHTEDVEPTSHVISLSNVTREDVPEASLVREDALRNAPCHTEQFYCVPKIIE